MNSLHLAHTANPYSSVRTSCDQPQEPTAAPPSLSTRSAWRFVVAAVAFCVMALAASALAIEVAWNPNPETNVTGYELSYGTSSGAYTKTVTTGTTPSTRLTDLLPSTTYFFSVRAVNSFGLKSAASQEISHTTQSTDPGTNNPPLANSASTSTPEDTPKPIILSATDQEGDSLTYQILTQPTNGSLSGTAPNITYTPQAHYHGTDSFTFRASDPSAASNTATISITVTPVNDTPVATAASISTPEDTPRPITLSGTDQEGSSLTYQVVTQPTKGSLTGTAPNLTYTPQQDFHGTDNFTFRASDGSASSNPASISITVTPVNDAPVATNASISTLKNESKGIKLNVTDKDGDSLTYEIVSGPANGSLSGTAPNLTYTPQQNYQGSDSLTFRAFDGSVHSNTGTISINVNAVNTAPVANAANIITAKNTPAPLILAATDEDGDTLSYQIVTQPSSGSLTGTVPNLTYTPASGFSGTDSFTFRATDGTANSNTATISLQINSTGLPDLISQNGWSLVSVDSEEAAGYAATAAFDGKTNTFWHTRFKSGGDPLPHEITISIGAPKSVSAFRYLPRQDGVLIGNVSLFELYTSMDGIAWGSPVATGTFANTRAVKQISFTPRHAKFFRFRALGEPNGSTHSAAAELNLLGTEPVNQAPLASSMNLEVQSDQPAAFTLDATDANSDPLSYQIVTQPASGTLSGTAPNLTYTPANGFTGSDSFTYQAFDGIATSALATVTIEVKSPHTGDENSAPSFRSNPLVLDAATERKSYTANISSSVTDPDEDPVSFSKLTGPSWLVVSASGRLSGTPPENSAGTHRFTVRASDPEGAFATTILMIAVDPEPLPGQWEAEAIGGEVAKADINFDDGVYRISAAGHLSKKRDAGAFAARTLTGDGQIVARVTSLKNSGPSTRAGVMIRDSLTPGSRHVFIGVDGKADTRFIRRAKIGPERTSAPGRNGKRHFWLKLVRKGDIITSYTSADGKSWVSHGSTKTNFGKLAHIGLYVSGGKSKTATATFRHVSVQE